MEITEKMVRDGANGLFAYLQHRKHTIKADGMLLKEIHVQSDTINMDVMVRCILKAALGDENASHD